MSSLCLPYMSPHLPYPHSFSVGNIICYSTEKIEAISKNVHQLPPPHPSTHLHLQLCALPPLLLLWISWLCLGHGLPFHCVPDPILPSSQKCSCRNSPPSILCRYFSLLYSVPSPCHIFRCPHLKMMTMIMTMTMIDNNNPLLILSPLENTVIYLCSLFQQVLGRCL